MTDQSIFNQTEATPQESASEGVKEISGVDQLLAGITNAEGNQKYATIEDALKGLNSAQEHISRLEQENTTFKQGVEKSTTLQDVLNAMKPQESEAAPTSAPTLDEGTIAELLEKVVERRDTASAQKSNASKVANKFQEVHGEEAEAKYYAAAAEVGFSKMEINRLSASNPTAVLKLLGVTAETGTVKPALRSDVTAASFAGNETEKPKFNPFQPSANSALDKWKKSAEVTNKRLGL